MKNCITTLLFILSLFSFQRVQATEDILFLNFNSILNTRTGKYTTETNGVNIEIEAAKKAAQKSGRKLIIFPDTAGGKINYDTLKEFLAKQPKDSFNSIVMSGHDGNSNFSGKNGEMGLMTLKSLFGEAEVKDSLGSVRSLHMLGCYTGVPGVVNEWNPLDKSKSPLPSLELVSGFDNKSPFADDPRLGGLVENLLLQEQSLLSSAQNKKIDQDILNTIKDINKTTMDLTVSLRSTCADDVLFYRKGETENGAERNRRTPYQEDSMNALIKECSTPRMQEKIASLGKQISCWRDPSYTMKTPSMTKAEIEVFCEKIAPDDPPDTQGKLRSIYSEYLASSHCFPFVEGAPPTSPESLLRLLFAENVFKNTMKHRAVQKTLKDIIAENGAESPQLKSILEQALKGQYVSRKAWILAMREIDTLIQQKFPMDMMMPKRIPEIEEATKKAIGNASQGSRMTPDEIKESTKRKLIEAVGKERAQDLLKENEKNYAIADENLRKRDEAYGKILSLQRFSDSFILLHDESKIPMNYIEKISQQDIDANVSIDQFLGKKEKK